MSPVQLVFAALSTPPVRSLTVRAGKSLLSTVFDGPAPTRMGSRPIRYCTCGRRRHAAPPSEVKHVVPGCVRAKVPGLWGDREWAELLESRLLALDGVNDARANPRTGRVLVLFDPQVAEYAAIERVLAESPFETPGQRDAPVAPAETAPELIELLPVDGGRELAAPVAVGH